MSLVGPRPLPASVEQVGYDVSRRLLVRPGMTGLWQVSGRSDLPFDESIRLDLYYVENWSPAFDLMILWKTARAVLRGAVPTDVVVQSHRVDVLGVGVSAVSLDGAVDRSCDGSMTASDIMSA